MVSFCAIRFKKDQFSCLMHLHSCTASWYKPNLFQIDLKCETTEEMYCQLHISFVGWLDVLLIAKPRFPFAKKD